MKKVIAGLAIFASIGVAACGGATKTVTATTAAAVSQPSTQTVGDCLVTALARSLEKHSMFPSPQGTTDCDPSTLIHDPNMTCLHEQSDEYKCSELAMGYYSVTYDGNTLSFIQGS